MENKDFGNNTLKLLDEVDKQRPSDDLVARMQRRTLQKYTKIKQVKLNVRSIMGIAASLLLLIMVNVYSMSKANFDYSSVVNNSESQYDLLAIQTLYDE